MDPEVVVVEGEFAEGGRDLGEELRGHAAEEARVPRGGGEVQIDGVVLGVHGADEGGIHFVGQQLQEAFEAQAGAPERVEVAFAVGG